MTNKIHNPTDTTYFIAYNEDKSILHNGVVEANNCFETALKNVEVFLNQQDWEARKEELGIVDEEELEEAEEV